MQPVNDIYWELKIAWNTRSHVVLVLKHANSNLISVCQYIIYSDQNNVILSHIR
jgi:hypothetical protein